MKQIWNKGQAWSDEVKQKISHKLKGRTPWNKGKHGIMPIPHNKGKKLSDETRAKISEAKKGQAPWNKGKTLSPEYKAKLSEAAKKRHAK